MRHKRITRKFISLINTPLVKYLLILLVFIFSINILGQFNFNLSFSPRKALANETVDVTPCPSGQVHQGQNCDCGCPADPPCTIPGQVKDASCVCGCPTPCPGNKTLTDPATGCGCSCPTPCTSPQVHGDDDLCICDCPASTAAAETACNNSCPQFHTCNWIDAECRCDEVCSIDASDCPSDNEQPAPSPACECETICENAEEEIANCCSSGDPGSNCICNDHETCTYDYVDCKCDKECDLIVTGCPPGEQFDSANCDCIPLGGPCTPPGGGTGHECPCPCGPNKCCRTDQKCCNGHWSTCCPLDKHCDLRHRYGGYYDAICSDNPPSPDNSRRIGEIDDQSPVS
jgi:hypothetical protein